MLFKREKKDKSKEKNKEPTYWERLIHGKGTVAEPWPTAEELWNDPKVQEDIQKVREAFDVYQKTQNKNSQSKDS